MDRVALCAPEAADLRYIAQHLRQVDLDELRAAHGAEADVEAILRSAVLASEESYIAVSACGEPVAVFGLAPVSLLGGVACPWMLGTDREQGFGREVMDLSRQHIERWGRKYDQLFNYVDARNTVSIRWLKRLGFTLFEAEPHGEQQLPFHRFERCT